MSLFNQMAIGERADMDPCLRRDDDFLVGACPPSVIPAEAGISGDSCGQPVSSLPRPRPPPG